MAHDDQLAERIRDIIGDQPGVTEKRMFGGLAFLVNGNMAVAAGRDDDIMVRVNPKDHDTMLDEPGAEVTVMRESIMRGWITVGPQACAEPECLLGWVRRGFDYANTLPPK